MSAWNDPKKRDWSNEAMITKLESTLKKAHALIGKCLYDDVTAEQNAELVIVSYHIDQALAALKRFNKLVKETP